MDSCWPSTPRGFDEDSWSLGVGRRYLCESISIEILFKTLGDRKILKEWKRISWSWYQWFYTVAPHKMTLSSYFKIICRYYYYFNHVKLCESQFLDLSWEHFVWVLIAWRDRPSRHCSVWGCRRILGTSGYCGATWGGLWPQPRPGAHHRPALVLQSLSASSARPGLGWADTARCTKLFKAPNLFTHISLFAAKSL